MNLSQTHIRVLVSLGAVLAVGIVVLWLTGDGGAAKAKEDVLAACAELDEAEYYEYTSVEVKEIGERGSWDRLEVKETYSGDEYHAKLLKFNRGELEEDLEWLGVDNQHWYRVNGGEWEELEEISWLLVPECGEYIGYKDLGTSRSPSGVEARHYAAVTEWGNQISYEQFSMTQSSTQHELWIDDQGRLLQIWTRYAHIDTSRSEDQQFVTTGIRTFSGWGEPHYIPNLSDLHD